MSERQPDWVRWVVVAPAAVGAWVGVQIVITVIGNFLYALGQWNLASWAVKIATIVAAPYCFVWVGAKAAPRRPFIVAVVLTVVHALAATTVLVLAVGVERRSAPLWWIITGFLVGIIVTIVACVQVRAKEAKMIDIPLSA